MSKAVVIDGIVFQSVCSGCKYYAQCGDQKRITECDGWEKTYSTNPLDDIDWDEEDA